MLREMQHVGFHGWPTRNKNKCTGPGVGEDLLLPSTRLDHCHHGKLTKNRPKNTGFGGEEKSPGQSGSTAKNAKNREKIQVLGEEKIS